MSWATGGGGLGNGLDCEPVIGTGPTCSSAVPVQVPGLSGVKAILEGVALGA